MPVVLGRGGQASTGGLGFRLQPAPSSEATASDFVTAGGNPPAPLLLKMKLFYPESADRDEEQIIDEFEMTNILENVPFVRQIPPTASTKRHMEPIFFGVARFGSSANFALMKSVTVTFRFRRVPPRGNEGV